jgi:hypothetical protein
LEITHKNDNQEKSLASLTVSDIIDGHSIRMTPMLYSLPHVGVVRKKKSSKSQTLYTKLIEIQQSRDGKQEATEVVRTKR